MKNKLFYLYQEEIELHDNKKNKTKFLLKIEIEIPDNKIIKSKINYLFKSFNRI